MGLKRDELRGVWPHIYIKEKTWTFWALARCRETASSDPCQWNRAELQQPQREQLRGIWLSQQRGRGAGHTSSTGHRRAQVTRGQARGRAGSGDKEEVATKDSWRGNGCLIQEELYHQRGTEQLRSHMFTRPAQAAGPAAVPGFWHFDLSSGKHRYQHKAGAEGLTEPKPKASNVLMHSPGQRSNTSVTMQSYCT